MSEFYEAGGWGMYPTHIFGVLLVGCSILFMIRPEPRYLASLVGLGATTASAGMLGLILIVVAGIFVAVSAVRTMGLFRAPATA